MRARPLRGFTLVELLITVAVTLVVISGVVVSMRSQQRAYIDGRRLREAQTSGRRALLAIEKVLPSAGFGMDASLAFDFNGWAPGACPGTMGGCARDSTANADELTFFARDPRYWIPNDNRADLVGSAWRIKAVAGNVLTVAARPGDVFRKGQILLAVCPGSSAYAYVTVATTASSAGATPTFLDITLTPTVTANPFQRTDVAGGTCFNANSATWATATSSATSDAARIFLINKYRFHVRPVQTGTLGTAAIYDPLLVLDRGLDLNGDGVVDDQDELIVAEGIESLQVGYTFYNGAIPQAGITAGTAVAIAAGAIATAPTTANAITATTFPGVVPAGQTQYQPSSFYPYTYGPPADPVRNTNHQANIQLVRVAVLARSLETETAGSRNMAQLLPILNQDAAPAWVTAYQNALGGRDGYQRVIFETSVPIPNMSARAMPFF